MEPRTHAALDRRLCGEPLELRDGAASVGLETTAEMAADERGLVHGGFVFGLADHAVMLAVNHPHVVLGRAEGRFLKPVVVGDRLLAVAEVVDHEGVRSLVQAEVRRGEEVVFRGDFVCYSPDRHVLDRSGPEEVR